MTNKHFRRFAREWSMQFLFQYDMTDMADRELSINAFLRQLEDTELFDSPADKKTFRKADRITRDMINGILDNVSEIDKTISEYSAKWTIERMDIVDRNVMRVAIYEMMFTQNVPPVVSINEAVEIGKVYGTGNTSSFINGVLNAIMKTLSRSSREVITEK